MKGEKWSYVDIYIRTRSGEKIILSKDVKRY